MISTHKGHLRIVFCITLLFLCLVSVHPTSAFDGAKSGFVLSVGPGAGWVYNDFTGGDRKKDRAQNQFSNWVWTQQWSNPGYLDQQSIVV